MRQLLLALALAVSTACCAAQTADARVRSALDLLADVIDPSYALAMQGCIARQDQIMTAGERDDLPAADVDSALHVVTVRCNRVRTAFETMRQQHDRAREIVGRGQVDEAQHAVDEIRALWSALQEVIDG